MNKLSKSTELIQKYTEEYENELFQQLNPYEMWINDNENQRVLKKSGGFCTPSEEANNLNDYRIVVFYEKSGDLAESANVAFLEYFNNNPSKAFAYADEDVILDGKRVSPWFKPELSPDTINSVNYFGSVFAIKTDVLLAEINASYNINDAGLDFIRKCEIEKDTVNVSRIGFDESNYDAYWRLIRTIVEKYEGGHIDRILFHGTREERITNKIAHIQYDVPKGNIVSIIIPSKDNPDMLFRCIKSIEKYSIGMYEIIVIDNGSTPENRNMIERVIFNVNCSRALYVYSEMDFNFSKMCNKGFENASGDVLLFLNDDITVMTRGWDVLMAGQALRSTTGAVGAKLYYPNSTIIQHVGITNMGIGPAHKLAGIDDRGKDNIYHGRNLADTNVYAVTAAALAITRDKFVKIGGFNEELTVGYNDVNLCFDLHKFGLMNIVRNDVVLCHHESLSRGLDDSLEKKQRLLKERKILYSLHPEANRFDPYYSRHLVQDRFDGEYNIGYMYPYECLDCISEAEFIDAPEDSSFSIARKLMRKGPVCQLNVDRIKVNEDNTNNRILVIEGWAGLSDYDEIQYDRHFLLKNREGKCIKAQVFNWHRDDVALVMPQQKYNKLLGFTCHIPFDAWDSFAGENIIDASKILNGQDVKSVVNEYFTAGIMFTNRLNGKTIVYYLENV